MRVIALAAVVLSLTGCPPPERITEPLQIQGDEDLFVAWQGFTHAWTHNHRWNRFGNWVEARECDSPRCWGLVHAAASGTSEDTAAFSAHYTEVGLPGAGFHQIDSPHVISDLLGGLDPWTHVVTETVSLADLPAEQAARLRDRTDYVAWFNGWDLVSVEGERAAKPIDFAMEVTDPTYDPDSDSLQITWRAFLRMGCSTPECRPEDVAFTYRLTPRIAMLGYDDEVTVYGPQRTEHTYEWDASAHALGHGDNPDATELEPAPVQGSFDVAQPSADHVPVLTRVYMHLFHWKDIDYVDMHMVEWRSTLQNQGRDGSTINYEVDLLFKQWVPGMARFQGFAYPDVGAATMRSDLKLLELPGATRVVEGTWDGAHTWPAGDRSADSDEAITRSWDVTSSTEADQ